MLLVDLKTRILQKLGQPYHTVNLSDDQMNILIQEAVHEYREHHHESTEKDVLLLDVVDGQRKYTLDPSVIAVNTYYKTNLTTVPLNIRFARMGLMCTTPIIDLVSFGALELYAKSVDIMLNPRYSFTYNAQTKQLTFRHTPKRSSLWGLEVFLMTGDDYAYGSRWVQEYSAALCKYQYGWNLGKLTTTLPGVSTVNYVMMMEEATKEKEKLYDELINVHSAPIPILFG
jgi:hypothetical protein